MGAIQDAERLIFTTWSSCSVSQDLLSHLQLDCGWLQNATEWRASVCPAAKEWRSGADSKEETYNPIHISWLSENLRFLDISTPSHRSVPHIPISRHNSLRVLSCSDSWDWGPGSPFHHGSKLLLRVLVSLMCCLCCRILSPSAHPILVISGRS